MNDTIQAAIDLTRDVLDKARRGGRTLRVRFLVEQTRTY